MAAQRLRLKPFLNGDAANRWELRQNSIQPRKLRAVQLHDRDPRLFRNARHVRVVRFIRENAHRRNQGRQFLNERARGSRIDIPRRWRIEIKA